MFSFKKMAAVVALTAAVGIAAYAVAYQFNDGKMGPTVISWVLFGMSFPSLIIGGVMRVFRPDLQRYFAIMALICISASFLVKWLFT